jgi:hypothetical protein
MSALSIQVPFPVFQGRDGQPLENGYVWIGEPNLNPQTNPVVAYFDAALTIPAAQPLRTLNGYISRAGTPAQIYVDGVNFSILVQDSKGSMVYNFPDGSGISPDACGVTYDPPFTGGVPYPVCEKLAQNISVLDFGADPAGSATANTLAIQAAIDACPVGGTLQGLGLTFPCTGVEVDKAITVDGLILDLVELIPFQTSQDAFTITANGVRLVNCGAITNETALPNTTNSAGVYSVGNSNILIDGGEWVGSISKNYTPGNWRGVIYIEGGEDCVVKNTITRDAFGEGLWVEDSTRAYITNNKAYNAGGSEIVFYSDYGLMQGNTLVGNPVVGNSGAAVGGDYVTIANNEIINASGPGISHGERISLGGLIIGNTVAGQGKVGGATIFSGILSQKANGLVISNNVISAPTAGSQARGISVQNVPVSAVIQDNKVLDASQNGIYFLDSTGVGSCVIRGNTIEESGLSGISVIGAKQSNIENNVIRNPNKNSLQPGSIVLSNPTGTPDYLSVTNNTVTSNNANSQTAVRLQDALTSSTQYVQHNNLFLNWTVSAFTSGRNCNYDVRGDNYDISSRSALVTLTNGGTTTVVTTAQVSSKSVVLLEIGNAAAATLNPVYRISTLADGSFTITHTAGTAAGEQLKWTII